MDRATLKDRAKQVIKRNRWLCVIVAFIMTLIGGNTGSMNFNFNFEDSELLEDGASVGGFEELFGEYFFGIFAGIAMVGIIAFVIGMLVIAPLHCGGIRFFLKNRKNHPVEIEEIIQNFRDKTFINIAKVNLVVALKILLWFFVFIIPGIIKSFEYWAVTYILAVRPDLKSSEAMDLSKKLMDGHKMDLFVLSLSFLGWNILSAFTLNILGIVYVYPYQMATFCEFYSEIRAEAIASGKITPYDIPDYQDYNQTQNLFGNNQGDDFTSGSFSDGQYNPPVNGAFCNGSGAFNEPAADHINADSAADFVAPYGENPAERTTVKESPAEPIFENDEFSEENATEVPFESVENEEDPSGTSNE